jgi:hypothetical protein
VTDDWLDLLTAFSETRVRFLVVGAHALAIHGIPRGTQDLDGTVRGRSFPFLGRADLIANKRAPGRPKDLADLDSLERLR